MDEDGEVRTENRKKKMMSFSYRVTIRWKLDFTPDMNDVMLQQKMILQNDDLKCHCFLV